MKNENDLNQDILKITMKIQDEYPELSKYITEMPETIPNNDSPKITGNSLEEYYNSLDNLLKKYTITHLKKAM